MTVQEQNKEQSRKQNIMQNIEQNDKWNDEGLDIEEILAQWEILASGVPDKGEMPEVEEGDVDRLVGRPTMPILSPVIERLIDEIEEMIPEEEAEKTLDSPAEPAENLSADSSGNLSADSSGNLSTDSSGNLSADSSGNLSVDSSDDLPAEPAGSLSDDTADILVSDQAEDLSDTGAQQSAPPIRATKPLSRKETAKLIATGKTSPIPTDEIADALAMTDTGFFVHSRYDVTVAGDEGSRSRLTREQKRMFSYFIPVRGMSGQIAKVLEKDEKCRSRNGTSRTGNILIAGEAGSGKTTLAVDVVKAIQKQRGYERGKAAVVTGSEMNRKKIKTVLKKLYGGALIIQKAEELSERTVEKLSRMMESDTGEMLIILEGQREELNRLLASEWIFRKKFTSYLEIPRFINDELITFAQSYAQEHGYSIDEMGILALYRRLDMMQREGHGVTVSEVKDVLDQVMEISAKASPRKLVKSVIGKRKDSENRILLTESDFKV